MKLIFLDVDGVLNDAAWGPYYGLVPVPEPWKPEIEDLMKWIDPRRVDLVNEIVRETGAEIILSSSTRSDPRMSVVLARMGLATKLLDTTPILQWETNTAGAIIRSMARADEIAESLAKWLTLDDIESFIVIDDQDHEWLRLAHFAGYTSTERFLVKTDFNDGGLKRSHVELAIQLLGRRA